MSGLPPGLSKTGSRRFSREGFIPLTTGKSKSERDRPSNDVTVDIPLSAMGGPGMGGLNQQQNEKSDLYQRRTAGRRVKRTQDGNDAGDTVCGGEQDRLTQMGRFYTKILNFSIVTRYIVFIVPLALIIAIPIVIGATAAKKAKLGGVRILWIFTWVEIVWLSLWVSKILARMLPAIFQFLCGIVSSGTRKYALVLKALEIPLSLVGWALASLATFIPLMTRNPDQRALTGKGSEVQHWQSVIRKLLAAALVASLIFLAERLLIHMISINYHRRQFDARIKANKRYIHLLGLLYEASRTLFPPYCSKFAEEDYIINGSITVGSKAKGTHQRSGSVTPMRLIRDVGRVGDKITAAFGNMASEITGKQVFNPESAHSVVVEALEKRMSSEALAKRLWMSFVVEGKETLYLEDIIEVLGVDRQAEAQEAFAAIDKDGNGDVSLDEMILAVVELGRERHSIASSLADVDQAINALDGLLCSVVFIIVVFVFVAFLNTSFSTTLATAGAALLSMSFAFAPTVQEILASCIFLFVKHSYDVGDRVDIKDDQLIVEHVSLLFSVFKRVENHRIVQIPHVVLNQCWIDNVSRSKAMREQVKIYINFDTTMEDISLLKNEMQAFVLDKENSREFLPEVEVEIIGIAEMNKLELKIEIKHKSNWSNETLRAQRRSKFMCALVLALRRIPIYAPGGGDAALGDVGKPTYSVAITDTEAAANREAFAAEKEAKRLFPSKKPEPKKAEQQDREGGKSSGTDYYDSVKNKSNTTTRTDTRPSTSGGSERTAVEALAIRHPGEDSGRDDWDNYREDMVTTPGGRTIAESRRGNDVEEVRGILHRESTRGRRKAGVGGNGGGGQVQAPAIPSVIAEVQTPPLAPRGDHQQPSSEQGRHPWGDEEMRRREGSQDSGTLPLTSSSSTQPTYLQFQPYSTPPSTTILNNTRPPPMGNAFAQQAQQQQRGRSPSQPALPPIQTYTSLPPQLPPPQKPLPKDP